MLQKPLPQRARQLQLGGGKPGRVPVQPGCTAAVAAAVVAATQSAIEAQAFNCTANVFAGAKWPSCTVWVRTRHASALPCLYA